MKTDNSSPNDRAEPNYLVDPRWMEFVQNPALVITDASLVQRLSRKVLKQAGFIDVTYISDTSQRRIKQALQSHRYGLMIVDTLNDFERVGAKAHLKQIGVGAGGRPLFASYHSGGESNDRVKYERLGQILSDMQENSHGQAMIVADEDELRHGEKLAAGLERRDKDMVLIDEHCYRLIQHKTPTKREIVEVRHEFFQIVYDRMTASSQETA